MHNIFRFFFAVFITIFSVCPRYSLRGVKATNELTLFLTQILNTNMVNQQFQRKTSSVSFSTSKFKTPVQLSAVIDMHANGLICCFYEGKSAFLRDN